MSVDIDWARSRESALNVCSRGACALGDVGPSPAQHHQEAAK